MPHNLVADSAVVFLLPTYFAAPSSLLCSLAFWGFCKVALDSGFFFFFYSSFYGPYHVVVCLLPTTYWIPVRQLHTVRSTSLFYCSISSHASSSPAAFAFSLHPPKNIPFRHRHAFLPPCHAVSQPLVSLKEPFPSSVLDSADASYPPLLSVRRRSRDIDIVDTFHRHFDDLRSQS
ncbi:hypothetical protein CKAH01_08394 [Colletotrichum kahawae]|uniref:Uncharacterized protein n=1 Tax=Colletotrichum kahawae TaxID=34407 RepID=A0AAD9Y319_COLKA|nr:hypothetical protein CKAH01_08394 [Colletotrichum kahawae]